VVWTSKSMEKTCQSLVYIEKVFLLVRGRLWFGHQNRWKKIARVLFTLRTYFYWFKVGCGLDIKIDGKNCQSLVYIEKVFLLVSLLLAQGLTLLGPPPPPNQCNVPLKAAPQRQEALGPPGASIMPRGPKGPGLLTQMKTCLPPLKANGNSVK